MRCADMPMCMCMRGAGWLARWSTCMQVRDLWMEEDVGFVTGSWTATKVEPHAVRLVSLK